MYSSNVINFTQNNLNEINGNRFIKKENRVIILTEHHASKDAVETWQKIMELTYSKKIIA